MSFDDAIEALSADALKFVSDGQILGLGSGRAATAFVKSLSRLVRAGDVDIRGVPTSLQIKMAAQLGGIPLVEADQVGRIDVVFDGADQIDSQGFVIKGGGGALLRENILIGMAEKVVIMADSSKFVTNLARPVPVEVHQLARTSAIQKITDLGGRPSLRKLERGYPFITENGNIILDCDFGTITEPESLRQKIIAIPGVMECGIFTRIPDVTYMADIGGRFETIVR